MSGNLLTPQEAAVILRLTERRVQQLCRAGVLGRRDGGRYVIDRADLERFKRLHASVKPGPKPKSARPAPRRR